MRTTELFEAADAFVENVKRRAVTDAYPHIMAESHARNGSHLIAIKKLIAEINGLETKLRAVYKEVESALRLNYAHIGNGLKTSEHELTTNVILTTQTVNERLGSLIGERGQSAILSEG
ncbi:MAG: hypothetical protein ACJA1W_003027, partial [Akkermansiaceae bacterium]